MKRVDNQSPIVIRFFDRLMPDDMHHLLGDMEEEFHYRKEREGISSARFRLWLEIFRNVPYFFFQSLVWNLVMLLNYLKISWRTLRKNLSFSIINILGLAVSMAVCLLIILFIVDQKSYDRFHEYSDRIYRVTIDFKSPHNNQMEKYATSPAMLADLAEEQFTDVVLGTKVRSTFSGEIRYEDKTVPLEGLYVDSNFLELFSFKMLRGNPETALEEPGSIILTEESAEKLFGKSDPMGKVVANLGNRDYTVTGILKNIDKTHFRFESLVSYSTLTSDKAMLKRLNNWRESIYSSYTYLLLKPGAYPDDLENQLSSLIPTHFSTSDDDAVLGTFNLQALTSINLGELHSNEIGMTLPNVIAWFLIGFAAIIILIACFNYVSMTVARALKRSKEVGVRKVMGAYRSNVIIQFLSESIIIALIALIVASLILQWLLPEFNSLTLINFTENRITADIWNNYLIYAIFLFFSVTVGILAGIYPALYLSSFSSARVLKGVESVRGFSGQALRKFITVSQFVFSIIFIITALVLSRQFNHMVHTDYGFTEKGIVNVALQDVPYQRFESAMERLPEVRNVAAASHIPALGTTHGVWMNSDSLNQRLRAHSFKVNENYIQTTGLNLIAGRNFDPDRSTDSTASILSTEAVKQLNLGTISDALGTQVLIDSTKHQVVGVIENFISADPMRKGSPIVLMYAPDRTNYGIVKITDNSLTPFLSKLENAWNDLGSLHSLKYKLLDEQLRENPIINIFLDFVKVIGLISVFSIIISCLGLLGMAMYTVENRIKEIGIRKVLGAGTKDIIVLLSKNYLLMVGIALLIGTPLAWLINNFWLQLVSNKVDIGPFIFIIGLTGIIVLSLITICSQTIRAARTKTVDNLRTE